MRLSNGYFYANAYTDDKGLTGPMFDEMPAFGRPLQPGRLTLVFMSHWVRPGHMRVCGDVDDNNGTSEVRRKSMCIISASRLR